jgi:microcystin-dependent protein
MTDQFVAEIRIFPFNFAPKGWAMCAGQLIPISQNTALFSLLGTTYGGDGKSTFALPNLQGRVPIQQGQGPGLSLYDLGQVAGEEAVTLLQTEMPQHNHGFSASTAQGSTASSNGGQLAKGLAGSKTQSNVGNLYSTALGNATTPLSPTAMGLTGGNLPHNNLMPYLTLNYCIALQGIYPPRS